MEAIVENLVAQQHTGSSQTDSDIRKRTKKKVKRGRNAKDEESSDLETFDATENPEIPEKTNGEGAKFSYRDMLTGSMDSQSSNWNDWGAVKDGLDMQFDDESSLENPIPRVIFSKEEKREMRRPWRTSLIVKLFGKVLGYQTLSNRIKQLWKMTGRYKIIDLGHDYFLFQFERKEDYVNVLEGSPWVIGGHYLIVRQWSPNFDPEKDRIEKVVAWIRFPGLPMEYYNSIALSKMGSHVGRIIKIDKNTEEAIRGKFARLCVELDLNKALVSKILVGNHVQRVEFEGFQTICFHCGKVEHRVDNCSLLMHNPEQRPEEVAATQELKSDKTDEDSFGPWMMVQRKNRKPRNRDDAGKGKAKFQQDDKLIFSNRFSNLERSGNKAGNMGEVTGKSSAKATISTKKGVNLANKQTKTKETSRNRQIRQVKERTIPVTQGTRGLVFDPTNLEMFTRPQFTFQAGSTSHAGESSMRNGLGLDTEQPTASLVAKPIGPSISSSSPKNLPQPNPPSTSSNQGALPEQNLHAVLQEKAVVIDVDLNSSAIDQASIANGVEGAEYPMDVQ